MNLRRLIQSFFLLLTLSVGVRFYVYIHRLLTDGPPVSRPAGVEAFLPISALMGLKKLIFTGNWDIVHPAGLTIFITIVLVSIVFKKSFCSSICPVGFVSEIVSLIGLNLRVPKLVFYVVSLLKYAVLGFFAYAILIQMNIRSIEMFLGTPYNILADAKMLNFFLHPSRTTLWVLVGIFGMTLLLTNFWCRFLCPYGGLLGLVSILSPFKVRRDIDNCTSCMKCTNVCPMHIEVHKKQTIHSPECFGCYECVKNRTEEFCLTVTRLKWHRLVPPIVASLFFISIGLAMVADKWNSKVPEQTYKEYLQKINTILH